MSVPSDFEALRAINIADVFKAGDAAATLTRTTEGLEFRYRPDWVAAGRPAIATTLPVTDVPVLSPGGSLPAYFTGLLPEGRRLGALRRAVKTSADDELSLLLAVGADAIGDVQLVPAGVVPAEVPARVSLETIGEVRFADLLRELGIEAQRTALPGVQDKTSAAMISLPVARAGERYILKLNPREFPHLVENEAFFLGAASDSGLPVPPSEVVKDADGVPGLLVTRFDRVTVDGRPRMRAVEDGCQVSGRPPADKYLLSTEAAFSALAQVCDARVVAVRDLLRLLAFAFLTGNGDAHAKNFSVLQELDGEWRVAPAYDVPSSQPYGDTTMALTVQGRNAEDYGADDFVALGGSLGVGAKAVRTVLTRLTERADLWLDGLDTLPFNQAKRRKLRRVIDYRRGRLTR